MKTLIFRSILLCFLLNACTSPKVQIPEFDCPISQSVTEYPDSSFFKEITCMYADGETLDVFDRSRGDVAIWNPQAPGNTFYTVGETGVGPEEVTSPVGFYPKGDSIWILDGGSLYLKAYQKDGFKKAMAVPTSTENRFFMNEHFIYLTGATDSSSYAKTPLDWNDRSNIQEIQLKGHLFSIIENEGRNIYRNSLRHIVEGEKVLYNICNNYPVLEKYDMRTDSLLESIDLTVIPYVDRIVKSIARKKLPEQTTAIFIKDVYWHDNKLYLLCADWEDQYKVNTVIALGDQGMLSPYCIYHLKPEQVYSAIAINNNHIYAANYSKCSIDTYDIISQ